MEVLRGSLSPLHFVAYRVKVTQIDFATICPPNRDAAAGKGNEAKLIQEKPVHSSDAHFAELSEFQRLGIRVPLSKERLANDQAPPSLAKERLRQRDDRDNTLSLDTDYSFALQEY